ncbi:putative nucleic-acid-binding Zn-ribbon protein [Mesorhizobium abyssinicae]
MAAPWDRSIVCEKCGWHNRVITHYAYGPAEETDTANCIKCGTEIAREKCGYIEVSEASRSE